MRSSRIAFGSISPAGNVDVTPFARKSDGIRGRFVLAAGVEQLDRVVRVEVEQSGNDRFGVGDDDSLGVRRGDREVAADAQELAAADEDAGIADRGRCSSR